MAKKNKKKKAVRTTKKADKKVDKARAAARKEKKELKALDTARTILIKSVESKLLSKSQLKRGGSEIRSRHGKEQGYESILIEINKMGKRLGYPPIGFGHLRKN